MAEDISPKKGLVELRHYEENGVFIVNIIGEIVGSNTKKINEYLKPMMDLLRGMSNHRGLVLDFDEVSMVDSAGIGLLCGKHLALKKENKKLGICYINQNIFRVITIAKVDNVLNIYPDMASALGDIKMVDTGIASTQINLTFLNEDSNKMPDFSAFHQEKKKRQEQEKEEQEKNKPKEFWEKK